MSATAEIQVIGLKSALRELNTVDKTLRRQLTKDFKLVTEPTVREAKSRVPDASRLPSGWQRTWKGRSGVKLLPWLPDVGQKYIKSGISGKQPKEFNGITRDLAVFYIKWAGAIDTIFDMAGRKNSSPMAAALTKKYGHQASRVMWPAFDNHRGQIEEAVAEIVGRVEQALNIKLAKVEAD